MWGVLPNGPQSPFSSTHFHPNKPVAGQPDPQMWAGLPGDRGSLGAEGDRHKQQRKVLCALHTASCPSRFQGIEVAQAFQKGTLGLREAYRVSKRRAVVWERQ